MTGLRLAVLQGMESLKGIVGDSVVGIVSKIANGDISGAWSDSLVQMSSLWATWSEGILKTFTKMADAVISVWTKATTFVSNKLLEVASLPGFNKVFEKLSGVDVRAEIERSKKLGIENPLGKTQQSAADSIASQADEMRAALDDVNQAAEMAAKKAFDSASASAKEGANAASDSVVKLQKELADMRAEAAKTREETNTEPAGIEGGTLGAPGSGGNGPGSATTGATSVTFSAAGLLALGQGGGSRNQTVRAINDARQDAKTAAAEQLAATQSLAASVALLGLTHP